MGQKRQSSVVSSGFLNRTAFIVPGKLYAEFSISDSGVDFELTWMSSLPSTNFRGN